MTAPTYEDAAARARAELEGHYGSAKKAAVWASLAASALQAGHRTPPPPEPEDPRYASLHKLWGYPFKQVIACSPTNGHGCDHGEVKSCRQPVAFAFRTFTRRNAKPSATTYCCAEHFTTLLKSR